MVVGCPIAIALGIVVSPVVDQLVLPTGGGESLSAVEDPGRIERPAPVQSIHGHNVDVVPPVIVGIIPPAAIDTVDAGLRPGEGVGYPSRQGTVVLAATEFYAVTLPFSRQCQSLNLNLAAERLAVAVVEDIVDLPVVGFDGDVVVLAWSHQVEPGADLVGSLRLHDVAADGVAVEGGGGALVAQGVDVLCRAGIAQFDAGEFRGLVTDAEAGLPGQVGLHHLVAGIVVVPADGAVGLDVVVEGTAEGREGIHAQPC